MQKDSKNDLLSKMFTSLKAPLKWLPALLLVTACVHEPPQKPCPLTGVDSGPTALCDPDVLYFEQDVLPILRSNCAKSGCHDAVTAEEDVVLDSYNSVMQTGDIKPCKPSQSKIIEVLSGGGEDLMPPIGSTPLTSEQISILETWIAQGAENFICENACDTTNVTFSGSIQPLVSTNCAGCHSGSSPSGTISLTNYTEIAAIATNGMMMTVLTNGPTTIMPPSGALPACKVDMVRIWVDAGAPNN
jgi:hypothetical protein